MSFGSGIGTAFGGEPVVAVSQPAAEIGAPAPITIDFTDEIDGPLPGLWETFVLSDDGTGAKAGSVEATPDVFFRVLAGLAGWFYKRIPTIPAPAAPFDERGVLAAPQGIVVGRNAEVAIIFASPVPLLAGAGNQEFKLEVLVGLRASADATSFVGGRVRAEWAAGVWTVPLVVEAIQAAGAAPVVLSSAVLPLYNDPLDLWQAAPRHELRVHLRGRDLTVTMDGVLMAQATVPNGDGSKVVFLVRAYNREGAVITAFPVVAGMQFRTLRDPARRGPPPTITGDIDLEAPLLPKMHLPLTDLVARKMFKQAGGRTFIATQDFEAEVPGGKYGFAEGDIVRATEAHEGQLLTSVVLDLAAMRAARRDF